jgi:LytS/YehU family sensor histidine kinase
MIAELSDLLRYAIQHAPEEEVTLRKEIVFLKQYLAIQQTGRQNPFLISWDIDSRVDQTLVPTLLLQPLLENSIRHGLSSGKGFGCIDILARQMGSRLFLQVRDNGTGLPEDWSFEQYAGIGLRNTKARLFQMFGTNHSFRISNVPEGGLCISLSIPFRTQSATPHLDLAA